jgi:hypothetical protein
MLNKRASTDRIETKMVLIPDLRQLDTLLEIRQIIRQEVQETPGTRPTKEALVQKEEPELIMGLMGL